MIMMKLIKIVSGIFVHIDLVYFVWSYTVIDIYFNSVYSMAHIAVKTLINIINFMFWV